MIPHYNPINLIKIFLLIIFLFLSTPRYISMRDIHPRATKRKISPFDGPDHFNNISSQMGRNAHKKLRKLPHVFSNVLELPFRSDADVAVEEGPTFFRFVAKIEVDGHVIVGDVRAHAVEIHPGVIKVVIRKGHMSDHVDLSLDQLEVDTWRFRLPSSTRPELATATFVDGELVVTVPKGGSRWEVVEGGDVWGTGGNRLVLVQ